MIIGLFPDLLSAGGVQRAGRHVASVLARYAGERGWPTRFLSLNDPPGRQIFSLAGAQYPIQGYGRQKARFVLDAWRAAGSAQLVVALHVNLAPISAMMKWRAPRLRSVIFGHGVEVWSPLRVVRRRALAGADRVAAPSVDTLDHLALQQGVPRNKLVRLPWGLDPDWEERLPTSSTLSPPDGYPTGRVILSVGRWSVAERYKGLDHLISVLPRLLSSAPDLSLVAIGDGDDRPRLESLAANRGVSARVRFLTRVTQNELMSSYAHCTLFALPSRGEGFGFVFLEAMACGKPVIGGAHGGTPEVIENGASGILVPHADLDALQRAIESLLSDPALAARMGERGRARVQQEYRFSAFAARLHQLLDDVMAIIQP
ncbi:MAG TPA: glycosyltransferase family 4 protein [Methylomirabilota bacterium]|nr:glycosyltransferase family 4 protein [Methylomirabilota bacterium]